MRKVKQINMDRLLDFYHNKRVLVTGHTGFKGSWLCAVLRRLGAQVTGYALPPEGNISPYKLSGLEGQIDSVYGDIRDYGYLQEVLTESQPKVVFHLAAQPLVLEGYRIPRETYEINVMGTVNLLEGLRVLSQTPLSVVNITTDKVYSNQEWCWGYRENEPLDGYDPYASSKSCSELVTASFVRSYWADGFPAVSTVRAGNVIGGGDFARDRIIPDCVRAAIRGEDIFIRNPHSVRPYQHVLEPLSFYLQLAMMQMQESSLAGAYNIGPAENDHLTTGKLADLFCAAWGNDVSWIAGHEEAEFHEANQLRLDCSKAKRVLGWQPHWDAEEAVQQTVLWYQAWQQGNQRQVMQEQIEAYFEL